MPELNAPIPHFYAYLRAEYLYNLTSHHGEFEPCMVVGVTSIPSRAIGFHVITNRGAMFSRLPISALVHDGNEPGKPLELKQIPSIPLHHLELWDCFSLHVAAFEFPAMKELRCATRLKDGKWYWGDYLFTLDWHSSVYAENAGDSGYKTSHVIRLDNGVFAAQPNNRVRWQEMSFITRPFKRGERPDYLSLNYTFACESSGVKWEHTEDSDRWDYEFEDGAADS